MKRLSFILAAFVLAVLHNLAPAQTGRNSPRAPDAQQKAEEPKRAACGSPEEVASVPEGVLDTELKDLDSNAFRLSDFKGRVVVLNFWATWCAPCRREVYELRALSTDYAARGVEVIGLSVENPELDAQKVRTFVQQYGMNYRVGWSDKAVFCPLTQCDNCVPQTFVISGGGRIVKRVRGFNPSIAPSLLRDAVEQALGEDAKGATAEAERP